MQEQNNFQAIKISEHVYWVGAIDWGLRDFHGYQTAHGTTYNAFLIMGEKPILIDTVKSPFYNEMLARIESVIEPAKIKYIVSNHAEMDHSGCLPQAIEIIKPEKVFTSKAAISALKDHFHIDLGITPINNNESLLLGNIELKFIETKMLHWPESMFTYCVNDKILFSQDGFGMHLATSEMYAHQNDAGIIKYEATKYYANILTPYSMLVNKLLSSLPQLNLDLEFIAPDHGPIWRGKNSIEMVLNLWRRWSQKSFEPKVVIVYDTMWGSTAKMAAAIAEGIIAADDNISVKVMPLNGSHRSDISTELLEAGALIVGSPTINNEIFPTVADTLCYLRGLKMKNLLGQAFGSYGWGGESINHITAELGKLGVELVGEPVKSRYVPTSENLACCRDLGKIISDTLKTRLTK